MNIFCSENGSVDCGRYSEPTCDACILYRNLGMYLHYLWCNGDCVWDDHHLICIHKQGRLVSYFYTFGSAIVMLIYQLIIFGILHLYYEILHDCFVDCIDTNGNTCVGCYGKEGHCNMKRYEECKANEVHGAKWCGGTYSCYFF